MFLGPPLPLNSKLYTLIEKDQELRLACLEPRDGKLIWMQPLAHLSKSIHQEIGRRIWAAHPAYGENVLVCPTHSGTVVAVDLLTHSLLWAHSYAPPLPVVQPQKVIVGGKVRLIQPYQPFIPKMASNWKNPAPTIAGGKVLIPAPDANALHCLNLRDGSLQWKIDRMADDCYLAGVYDGKVLIVGNRVTRAFNLADGKLLWTTVTGMPSGQGIAAGKHYYLPLRGSNFGLSPALCTLDITSGKVLQRTTLPQNALPGNLLLHQGRLLSQTAMSITAFAP